MANAIYMKEGTSKTFQESGGDVTWTPKNVATGAGRISNQLDLGASPRPKLHRWELTSKFQTATVGNVIRLYIVRASSAATTLQDGVVGITDAGLSTEALIQYTALPLGPLTVHHTTASQVWRGTVVITARYVQVAVWNISGVSLTNTAGDHIFTLTPLYDEVQ